MIEEEKGNSSVHIVIRSYFSLVEEAPPEYMSAGSNDDMLPSGDDTDSRLLLHCNLFLIVEFQKFFISLSVLPGSRAAI